MQSAIRRDTLSFKNGTSLAPQPTKVNVVPKADISDAPFDPSSAYAKQPERRQLAIRPAPRARRGQSDGTLWDRIHSPTSSEPANERIWDTRGDYVKITESECQA